MSRSAGGGNYGGILATAKACGEAAKPAGKKPKHKTMETTQMAKKLERIYDLRHALWRNIANGVFTSGYCATGCGKMARGAGLCADCLAKELGELIGKAKAARYVKLIREVRALELKMDNAAEGIEG